MAAEADVNQMKMKMKQTNETGMFLFACGAAEVDCENLCSF